MQALQIRPKRCNTLIQNRIYVDYIKIFGIFFGNENYTLIKFLVKLKRNWDTCRAIKRDHVAPCRPHGWVTHGHESLGDSQPKLSKSTKMANLSQHMFAGNLCMCVNLCISSSHKKQKKMRERRKERREK